MKADSLRDVLPAGKLPPAELAGLLERIAGVDPRLLVGPRVGEDAAVIDAGHGRRLVVSTDPITFATDRLAWYAVHVNANDIAVMGARPLWFSAVVLMPEGVERSAVRQVLEELGETCRSLGVALVGGHTEVTGSVTHPVVVGQMIGEADAGDLVTKSGLQAGDAVILTHGAAIEGTALLARELAARLAPRVEASQLARARRLLDVPGISVVPAARLVARAARVHAMHDPTEGGVLTGLHELATAADLGLQVWADRIPVLPETRAVCDVLQADPLFLIASGALLVGCPPGDAARLLGILQDAHIPAAVVAEARSRDEGILVERHGVRVPLLPPARDEVARLLETPRE